MTTTEDQLMNPSTSEQPPISTFYKPPIITNLPNSNGDSVSLAHSNGNIRLRKDMAALRPVPIKISNDKLLDAHGPRYEEDSLERFCPSNRMPRFYAHFGYFVGLHPLKFIILGLLIASLSFGMYYVKLEDNVRDGYTPTTSRARQESDILRSFLNSTIDPVTTIMIFRAKDNSSMHRLSYLQETLKVAKFLNENLTISYQVGPEDPIKTCKFSDFCGSFCNSHYFLRSFMWALEGQIKRYKAGKPLSAKTNLTFPLGKTNNFEYHLEGNLFGVKIRDANDSRPLPKGIVPITNYPHESVELSESKAVSYIDFVDLVMLVFRGDFVNPDDEVRAKAWEMGAYNYLKNEFKSDLIEPLVMGNGIVDYEMKQDGKKMTPFFIIGFTLTLAFVIFTVIMDSIVERVMDAGKLIVALVLIVCPGLSITTTFGIFGLLDQRINSVSMIMPFLIMGIGVNDAFLMLHAWHRTSIQHISIPQRMGLILEDVGPSITITTITDVTTFILGSLTPTAEISLFCRTTAVALLLCYVFTLLLFLPILCFCSRLENPNSAAMSRNPNSRGAKLERIYDKVSIAYCKWIMHPATGIVVILLVVSFLAFAIIGFIRIDARLDTEKILPYDSPIRKPHELMAHKIWPDYYPVTIFVNKPLDLDDQRTMERLNQMVNDFEQMDKCKGKKFTHLWVRDYENFRKEEDFTFVDFFSLGEDVKRPPTTTVRPRVKSQPYYRKMDKFLNSAYYTHYRAFLQLDFSYDIPVRRFWFTVTYHNTSNWNERIDLMLNLREVADRYEDLDVSVWEVHGLFVDQMLSLKYLTYYNGIITILCMTVMCIFFISQWFLVCLAVLSIASITIEVIGCLSWWGLDLDPVTLCAILMSIGMSVDFTAHIAYHLKLNDILRVHDRKLYRYELETNQHKVIGTLEAVGWPTVQAGTSTVVCILPLIFLQNYIPLVFVKTISLVVICGLMHGLIIMPAVFALSWQCLGYMRKVFGCNHHENLNRHVHSADVLPPRRGDSLEQREKPSQAFSYSNLLLSTNQTEKQDLLMENGIKEEDDNKTENID